jgi:hypothetical protein
VKEAKAMRKMEAVKEEPWAWYPAGQVGIQDLHSVSTQYRREYMPCPGSDPQFQILKWWWQEPKLRERSRAALKIPSEIVLRAIVLRGPVVLRFATAKLDLASICRNSIFSKQTRTLLP